MNAYFDTSAIVPLLIDEAGSDAARQLWDEAIRILSVRLLYPEARAAMAQAHRIGRLTAPQLRAAVGTLEDRYPQVHVVEIDDELARRAGGLAEVHGLRGYDAVHLAAADRASDRDLVVVAGDRALLGAAASLGLTTATVG